MNVIDATQDIKHRVIPGVRGVGAFAIVMDDGREYMLVSEYGEPLVERFSDDGELLEQTSPGDVVGKVEAIRCCVDELGGIACT